MRRAHVRVSTFDNENWSRREICIDRGKEMRSRIAGDTWNSRISSFCAWLNTPGEYSIRKYSPFCRVAFLLIPAESSSLSRRRDFLSGKGKHANHKRRFRKTPPPPVSPMWFDANCTFSKQRATTPRRAPTFLKFARRGRSYVSCLLSAQFELTSSSGVLRRALHRFDEISRETRPCLCSK